MYEQIDRREDREGMQAFCDSPSGKSLKTVNLDEVGTGARVPLPLPTDVANYQHPWESEGSDINGYRERYIQACNPPRLHVTTNDHIAKIANPAIIQPLPDLLTQSQFDNSAPSLSCLTTEGKRQVSYLKILYYA